MAYDATMTDPTAIQSAMKANSDAYASADLATQHQLHNDNISYASKTGQTYNSGAGTYSAPNPSTNVAYPGGQPTGTTGTTSQQPSLIDTFKNTLGNIGGVVSHAANSAYQGIASQMNAQTPFANILGTNSTPSNQGLGTQSDGTLHLNVNGQPGTDVKVFKGTSFDSARDLANQLGLPYSADPKTGEITIGGIKVSPTSYDKNGDAIVGIRSTADSLGYKVEYDKATGTVTVTAPVKQTGDQVTGWTPLNTSGMSSQMMPYGTFNNDMNGYYNQAHNQLDAQYNQQKQALIDKQNLDISKSDESMNRRGIYSSGVAQSVEDDLRNHTTAAVANVLASQMANVAKTAQGLYNEAYKQYMDGNTFALKNNQAVIGNMLNAEKQSFNEYIQTHKLSDAELNAANAEFDKQAALIQKDNQSKLPYQQQTANNIANNQTNYTKIMGFDQNGHPTLETFKALGYIQMPDGSMQPTEQANNNSRTYAMNLAKEMGYVVTPDGKMIPTEQSRHNMATEDLTAAGQQITKDHNIATEANAAQVTKQNGLKETNTNLYNIWKATGKAPAGIDGVTVDTPFVNSTTKIDPKESYNQSASIKSQLDAKRLKNDGTIDKVKAMQFIDANKDVLTDLDYRDLKDWATSKFIK